jgi:hypothetical protein
MPKKSALEIYALAVCLFAVVFIVIAMAIALYDIVRVAFPNFTLNAQSAERYGNNDAYWDMVRPRCFGENTENCDAAAVRPPEEEVTRRRTRALETQYENERRTGEQGLVQALIFTLVAVAVFAPHWLIARRSREQSPS